jgi:carboxyl-terminal processing protease
MTRPAVQDHVSGGRANGPSRRKVVLGALLAVQLVLALVLLSYRVGTQHRAGPALPPEFAAVAQLYERIQREAMRVPADETLARGALEGMIGALGDPHAAYFDARAFAAFSRMLDGEFSGVGIQLQDGDKGPVIVSVFEATPAARAGIEAGERIVSVDGKDVRDVPTEGVAALITGDAGTVVEIGLDGGPHGARRLRLTRARIELPDVKTRLEDGRIGYIRLLQFSAHAGLRVREAALELAARGAQGIVLDLRGNPGGLLREAVEVASVFVEDGAVVSVRNRGEAGEHTQVYRAEGDALEDLPLVVLVDGWSASASEIVAGAVQDLGRGRIVGEKTYGKGSVQTVEILGDGGVKFTTAEYLTPSGRSIEGVGVVPDLQVAGDDKQLAAARDTLRALFAANGAAQ